MTLPFEACEVWTGRSANRCRKFSFAILGNYRFGWMPAIRLIQGDKIDELAIELAIGNFEIR